MLAEDIDDGSDLEIAPVPDRGVGIVPVLGELPPLNHLLVRVPSAVRSKHSEELHGVICQIVLEGEPLKVSVQALPVVPDTVQPQNLPVVLEEALPSGVIDSLSKLRLGKDLHWVLPDVVGNTLVPSRLTTHEFLPHGSVNVLLTRDGAEHLLWAPNNFAEVLPRRDIAVCNEEDPPEDVECGTKVEIVEVVVDLVAHVLGEALPVGKVSLRAAGVLKLLLHDLNCVILEVVKYFALADTVVLDL
mmetsp:Transcript_17711/g.36774  ORF Transcript_17711/g.36774 Transcript_17711/m.36774 type:complete len:245 (-) Transcript_17711:268-1002(-)